MPINKLIVCLYLIILIKFKIYFGLDSKLFHPNFLNFPPLRIVNFQMNDFSKTKILFDYFILLVYFYQEITAELF